MHKSFQNSEFDPKVGKNSQIDFYFLFTIVMKVLISCTEKPKFFIEVLDELEPFINKKVIFDEKKISGGLPSVSKFCNPHNFFPFQPRHFSFSG
jgi:hypothetical protein